jgi:hypothetical protein
MIPGNAVTIRISLTKANPFDKATVIQAELCSPVANSGSAAWALHGKT